MVVESSSGHSQLYFRLRQPVSPERGAALNRRLASALGGDLSGWDLTQLLRVPRSLNHKYREAPVVTVLQEMGRVYDLGQLMDPLPELPLLRRAVEAAKSALAG